MVASPAVRGAAHVDVSLRPVAVHEIDVSAAGPKCENATIPARACATSGAECTVNFANATSATTLTASAGTFVNDGWTSINFTETGSYVL